MNLGVLISLSIVAAGLVIVLVVFLYAWHRRREKAPPHVKPVQWDDD